MSIDTQRHAACCELVHDVVRSTGEVRLRVVGASMLPAIWPGDVITVRHCDLAQFQPGQIALYRRNGKLTAHRILELSTDHLIARGDSVPTLDPPVQFSEIVGRVVCISRTGRPVRLEQSSWQRVASSMFRSSDLLMRVTLYFSRRLRRSWDMQTSWTNPSPMPIEKG